MINLSLGDPLTSTPSGYSFSQNGIRSVHNHFSQETIDQLRKEWQEFTTQIEPYPASFWERGIVLCAGGISYFTCAWINIHTLRKLGCTLPIEVWYNGTEELTPEIIEELKKLNVICKNLKEYITYESEGYAIKPLAILFSAFKEVLYLDADNNCTIDTSYLFDGTEYKRFGTLFWPDYWKTAQENPIWKIVDSGEYEMFEQESGQLLIDKERCWKELQLCSYFNLHRASYYQILHGDKDT